MASPYLQRNGSFCFSLDSISAIAVTTGFRQVSTTSGLSGRYSGEVVSLPLLRSTGLLERRVRRADENQSNCPSPSTSGTARLVCGSNSTYCSLAAWSTRQRLPLTFWCSRVKLFWIESIIGAVHILRKQWGEGGLKNSKKLLTPHRCDTFNDIFVVGVQLSR